MSALIAAAPNPPGPAADPEAMAGLIRVSEALALETHDLRLDTDRPTLRVRGGKGRQSLEVPVHPELQAALIVVTNYGVVGSAPLISLSLTTAWRWVQQAARRAIDAGQVDHGRHVGTPTLRYSYAHHLLLIGIPLNYLSRWLGHASIQTTLIYLELVPDPSGSVASVP